MVNYYNLYIPLNFNFIVVKNKNSEDLTIILYNNNTSLTLVCKKNNIKISIESYCIKFINRGFNKNLLELNFAFNYANKYLKSFESYFFIKIKFKGKGFKIKFNKKLKLIKFYFGRSHITFFKLKKIKLKKITKYKFLLKSLNLAKLKKKSSEITYIKPVNLYTLRGIRVSRQTISKRKGKKSSYM